MVAGSGIGVTVFKHVKMTTCMTPAIQFSLDERTGIEFPFYSFIFSFICLPFLLFSFHIFLFSFLLLDHNPGPIYLVTTMFPFRTQWRLKEITAAISF